ncbi:MAG TPA: hypothetical protein VF211_11185 [Burkholderiales bacterium]
MNRFIEIGLRVAVWFAIALALTAALILGALALGFVLIVAPIVLLVAGWLVRRKLAQHARERPAGATVYEGEYRVLEERRER